ncbi:MAG: tRNA pseudouridine(54/55) synthase Pus10 [Candidatus Caldarchaeum sp.]
MDTILEQALALLKNMPLCDYCLGRQFARLWPQLSNKEKGRAIKLTLFLSSIRNRDVNTVEILAKRGALPEALEYLKTINVSCGLEECGLCGGVFTEENFRRFAEKAVELIDGYEFETFLVGAKASAECIEREDTLRSLVGVINGEDIRNDVKREVAKNLTDLTGRRIDYAAPDIVITVDVFREIVQVFPNPVFVKGRYLKHSRDIPQSLWHCPYCWGKGCQKCGFTGRKYPTSVAELVGEPAQRLFQAEDYKFHAAGREDVDALVAGEGRPFILELKKPMKRRLPLVMVEKEINQSAKGLVTVFLEEYTNRKQVRLIKATSPTTAKTYLLKAVYDVDIDESLLKKLEEKFRKTVIDQLTPTRVLRRRTEKLRRKTVYEVEARLVDARTVEYRIRCQGGLYVKELATGDGGRTKPSFVDVLGVAPVSMELTVVRVEM